MVKITDLPISTKMQKRFETFFKGNDFKTVHLGEFMKLEDGGMCAVCGHPLIWSFHNMMTGEDIGICCGTNIYAIQKADGDYSKLNVERHITLMKRTIAKNQAEWKRKEKVQKLEIQYNREFQFCSKVVELALQDEHLKVLGIVSKDDDDRNEQNDGNFFYAGLGESKSIALKEVYQCNSWLNWLNDGVVNDFHLNKLRTLIDNTTPEEIITKAKENIALVMIQQNKKEEESKKFIPYYHIIMEVRRCRLGKFDEDFVNNLCDFFRNKEYYTEKQMACIKKLAYKYRGQLKEKYTDFEGEVKNGN